MKEFINKHFDNDEDRNSALNLYEKYQLAKNKDITTFGNSFYTPNVWKWFEENLNTSLCSVKAYGIFEDSERRMISFNNEFNVEYPMKLLKVENTSKFKELSHKDYLGGILALGIQRNKIGDLLVKDSCCYVAVHSEIEEFLIYNIDKIGKLSCRAEIVDDYSNLPHYDFKEEVVMVSSLRLDGIVSKLSKVSRAKAVNLIEQGAVLIDYVKVKDKSHELKGNERITIRGTGKFILGEKVGNSKSGKIKINIRKYT